MNWTCPDCGAQGRFRDGAHLTPIHRRPQGPARAEVPRRRRLNEQVSGAPTRILVIDDSNTIRRSAEILKQGGHEVALAEDGFDALAKVGDFHPDLIFCDILMPRLDGYQTCAIIKRNPQFSGAGDHAVVQGRPVRQGPRPHGGSQDYLTKPFTKDQLLQAVLQHRP
jgi:twitching motility two-component system response regulator PilG